MTKDVNRVQLLGHLGAEPELRYLDTGQAMATFSVATSRRWRDAAGQDQEETEWTRIVAWAQAGRGLRPVPVSGVTRVPRRPAPDPLLGGPADRRAPVLNRGGRRRGDSARWAQQDGG